MQMNANTQVAAVQAADSGPAKALPEFLGFLAHHWPRRLFIYPNNFVQPLQRKCKVTSVFRCATGSLCLVRHAGELQGDLHGGLLPSLQIMSAMCFRYGLTAFSLRTLCPWQGSRRDFFISSRKSANCT